MAVCTLPGAGFLWLVLQNVLPRGLRRARKFGFLHTNSAAAILMLQVLYPRCITRVSRREFGDAGTAGLALRL